MERLPLLEETIRFWQPRTWRPLTPEDARQMVEKPPQRQWSRSSAQNPVSP
jgi:hypothetical protein